MAIRGSLYAQLVEKTGSPATLSRLATAVALEYGPMTPDEARLVIGHDLEIPLAEHGIGADQLERVRTLRASGASLEGVIAKRGKAAPPAAAAEVHEVQESDRPNAIIQPPTPSEMFNSRCFHPVVVEKCRRLFTTKHPSEAIQAAFKSVNNRVKSLSGLKGFDGAKLMVKAFSEQSPVLRPNDLSNTSEIDEHNGLRFLMTGAILALRNPRAHEDTWEPDSNADAALECLAFASLLHRFLDRCKAYSKQ